MASKRAERCQSEIIPLLSYLQQPGQEVSQSAAGLSRVTGSSTHTRACISKDPPHSFQCLPFPSRADDTTACRWEKRGKTVLTDSSYARSRCHGVFPNTACGWTVGAGVAKSFRRKSAPRLGKLLQFRALRGSSRTVSLLLAFALSLRQAGISSLCCGESFSCDQKCTGMDLGVAFWIRMYEDNHMILYSM